MSEQLTPLRPFSYDRPPEEWRVGTYFFQYGPWDLRVHCVCGANEAFMTGLGNESCAWEGGRLVFRPQYPCRGCGTRGPFVLEGADKCRLDCVNDVMRSPLFRGQKEK